MKTVSIIVRGRVQGVYFRQSTVEKARALNVKGTVKNVSDGSVHIIATGQPGQVDELVQWCWRGPDRAMVTSVEAEPISLTEFSGFTIAR